MRHEQAARAAAFRRHEPALTLCIVHVAPPRINTHIHIHASMYTHNYSTHSHTHTHRHTRRQPARTVCVHTHAHAQPQANTGHKNKRANSSVKQNACRRAPRAGSHSQSVTLRVQHGDDGHKERNMAQHDCHGLLVLPHLKPRTNGAGNGLLRSLKRGPAANASART